MRARDVLFGLFLLGAAVFLALHAGGYASGSDQSGYLNTARLLTHGRATERVRPIRGVAMSAFSPWDFTPLGFKPGREPDVLLPTYPPGLPLHQALAAAVVGLDRAARVVDALSGALILWLLYRLGRELGLAPGWSAAATLLFAVSPLTIHFFTWAMSDGLDALWCTAAVYFALRSHRRARYAALSGFALGAAVLVRPSGILMIPALALALPWRVRPLVRFVLAGVPALAFLLLWNHALFGSPFRTGYGDMSAFFAWRDVWPTLVHFALWLSRFMTPLAIVLWLALAARVDRDGRRAGVLFAWFASFVLFYACYRFSRESWWYLRFILPGIPGLLLGAFVNARDGLAWLRRRWPTRRRLASLATASLAVVWAAGLVSARHWDLRFRVPELGLGDRSYPLAIAWMEGRVEPDAAILCMQTSGSLFFYSPHPIVRYDIIAPDEIDRLRAAARAAKTPVYALVFEFEVDALKKRFPGGLEEIGSNNRSHLLRLVDPVTAAPEKPDSPAGTAHRLARIE